MFEAIMTGLGQILTPTNILLVAFGVLIGMAIGSLPGLSTTMGVAILMPITFGMDVTSALCLLLGIYNGGMYGGSIAAIMMHIPGTPAAMMTAEDGYPMAQKGQAGRAVGISTISSFFGGIFSVFVLMALAPVISSFALSFGPPEYFVLAIFGLSAIIGVSKKDFFKSVFAGLLGLLIATVGLDPVTSTPRFTFGTPNLMTGVEFIPVMIGLFGMAEVFKQVDLVGMKREVQETVGKVLPSKEDIKKIVPVWIRGSIIGSFIGTLPGAGATIASFISYNSTKQVSKRPELFGTGIPEGIAAPESANNAVTGGALVPLLTLGIPGNAVTAILIGAFMIHNITPGPMLFQQRPELMYSIYGAMFFANFGLLVFGLLAARVAPKVLKTPPSILHPIVAVLCIVGSFSIRNSLFDVGLMLLMGIIGYLFGIFGFPVAPAVLGIVLGPIAEVNLRSSLLLSHGNPSILFSSPITLILWLATAIMLLLPFFNDWKEKRKQKNFKEQSLEA